jgi:hypothetical protein
MRRLKYVFKLSVNVLQKSETARLLLCAVAFFVLGALVF